MELIPHTTIKLISASNDTGIVLWSKETVTKYMGTMKTIVELIVHTVLNDLGTVLRSVELSLFGDLETGKASPDDTRCVLIHPEQ